MPLSTAGRAKALAAIQRARIARDTSAKQHEDALTEAVAAGLQAGLQYKEMEQALNMQPANIRRKYLELLEVRRVVTVKGKG